MLTTSVLRKACRVLGWTAIGTWPERLDGVGTDWVRRSSISCLWRWWVSGSMVMSF